MAGFGFRSSRARSAKMGVLVEPLEPRLFLSYAISDYYPLGGGQTWNYTGTADGFSATATMFADSGFNQGGVSTTRLLTQLHDVNGTFTNSRFWNQSSSGLKILREDHAQGPQTDTYPNGGALVATSSVDAGQVVPYSTQVTSTIPSATFYQNVQGSVTYYGEEPVVTPAGTFTALKFTQNGSATVVGSTAHGTRTETQWLVKGLGIVKIQYTEVDYYTNGTQNTDTVLLSLTGSSLLRPVIALAGNSIAISSGDTTPSTADGSNFGGIEAQNGTNLSTFTITNNGTQTLNLGSSAVAISGVNQSRFVVVSQPPTTIAPGASSQFSIRFVPGGQVGVANATISIASSDPVRPSYTFAVRGTGLALPKAQVSGNHLNIDNGDTSPTTADWSKFAGIDALYMTKVRIFTITNTGLATLNLTGATPVTISGANADRFVVFVQPAATLAPGASTQFRVRFSPGGQVGFANATITIASSDPVTSSYTFGIQGNGLALPRAQVSSAGINIATGDSTPDPTDKTDFGSVVTSGTANRVRLFTITNIGLAALTFTGVNFVTITGPNASDFFVSAQPTTNTLAPGQSITFKVRFDPTATGSRAATVVIDTNENINLSPSAGHYNFAIAGIGV